jgi:hypothetical protein
MGAALRGDDVEALRDAWASAGRDGEPSVAVISNPTPDGPPFAETLMLAADLGVDRVLYHVYEGGRDRMLRRLDRGVAAMG